MENRFEMMTNEQFDFYAAERVADLIWIQRDNLSHTAIGGVLTRDLAIIRSSIE